MNTNLYHYKAKLIKVEDGDTLNIAIDLGFHLVMNTAMRLDGIDSPEKKSKNMWEKEANQKIALILDMLLKDKEFYVKTVKFDDKFGRYLGIVYLSNGTNVNETLLKLNLVRPYYGEKKEPWNEDLVKTIASTALLTTVNETQWGKDYDK